MNNAASIHIHDIGQGFNLDFKISIYIPILQSLPTLLSLALHSFPVT